MAFNDTFNNISVISWGSVLLVEEIGVPGENDRPSAIHCYIAMGNGRYPRGLMLHHRKDIDITELT